MQKDPKKSPRTSILMALFFKVSGYALYNGLAYFLSYWYLPHGEVSSFSGCLGWATLFYCRTP